MAELEKWDWKDKTDGVENDSFRSIAILTISVLCRRLWNTKYPLVGIPAKFCTFVNAAILDLDTVTQNNQPKSSSVEEIPFYKSSWIGHLRVRWKEGRSDGIPPSLRCLRTQVQFDWSIQLNNWKPFDAKTEFDWKPFRSKMFNACSNLRCVLQRQGKLGDLRIKVQKCR